MSLSGSPGYPALSLTSMPWCGTAVGHHQWDICFFFKLYFERILWWSKVRTLCFHGNRHRSIPGQGTKILHAGWHSQKKKKIEENPYFETILLSHVSCKKKIVHEPQRHDSK